MGTTELGSSGKVFRFITEDGLWLDGILYKRSSSKICVIFLHGLGGTFINNISLALASGLDKNMSFFSFNNRGHDEVWITSRIAGRKRKRFLAGTYFEKFEDCVYDIGGAIKVLRKMGFRSFVLCGHSTGCQKAVYYQYKTKDRRVIALLFLAPADDYNLDKKELGKKYKSTLNRCRTLIKQGRGNEFPYGKLGFSAQRFASLIDPKRVESRLFNYNGDLREFASIKTPMLAVFGSKEEYRLMPVKRYLNILKMKSKADGFSTLEILGGDHSFNGKERELIESLNKWISNL